MALPRVDDRSIGQPLAAIKDIAAEDPPDRIGGADFSMLTLSRRPLDRNATHLPSGENNGDFAPSVPGTSDSLELIETPDEERGCCSRLLGVGKGAAVWREREVVDRCPWRESKTA